MTLFLLIQMRDARNTLRCVQETNTQQVTAYIRECNKELLPKQYIDQYAHNVTSYRERSRVLSIPMNTFMQMSEHRALQEN